MNVINRLLGLLLLLLVLAAALATIRLVTDLLTVADVRQVWAYGPVVTITHDVGHLGADRWPWVLGGAIVAGLLALILLVRELTPPSRRARVLVLPGPLPSRTEVPYSALDELAERSAREVSGVERVRAGGTAAPGSAGALPGAGQPLRGPGDNRTGAAAHDCGASAARDRAARAGAHDRAGGAAAAAGAHDRAAGAAAGALGGRTR